MSNLRKSGGPLERNEGPLGSSRDGSGDATFRSLGSSWEGSLPRLVAGTFGIGASTAALVCFGIATGAAVVEITAPTLIATLTLQSSVSAGHCLITAAEGAIIGLTIGSLYKALTFRSRVAEGFISNLLRLRIFQLDPTIVPVVLLSVIVSSIVGYVGGASGAASVWQSITIGLSGPAEEAVRNAPLMNIVEVAHQLSLFDLGIICLLLIAMTIVIQAVLIGVTTGLIVALLYAALNEGLRGGIASAYFRLINCSAGSKCGVWQSIKLGIANGFIVGLLVGLLQSVICAILIDRMT